MRSPGFDLCRRMDTSRRDGDALADLHAPDGTFESPAYGIVTGRSAIREVYKYWYTAFPDFMLTWETALIDPPRASYMWSFTGTTTGPFFGETKVGTKIAMTGATERPVRARRHHRRASRLRFLRNADAHRRAQGQAGLMHVFVTGAGAGVGRAIALRFASDGYGVSLVGRTASSLQETAALISAAGGTALHLVCDVAVRRDVHRAVDAAERELGPIDVLVNNAGVADSAPFISMDDELWERTLAINLTGTYHCMRAIAPGDVRAPARPDHQHRVQCRQGRLSRTPPPTWRRSTASSA